MASIAAAIAAHESDRRPRNEIGDASRILLKAISPKCGEVHSEACPRTPVLDLIADDRRVDAAAGEENGRNKNVLFQDSSVAVQKSHHYCREGHADF
jgi:hypothetical protein